MGIAASPVEGGDGYGTQDGAGIMDDGILEATHFPASGAGCGAKKRSVGVRLGVGVGTSGPLSWPSLDVSSFPEEEGDVLGASSVRGKTMASMVAIVTAKPIPSNK